MVISPLASSKAQSVKDKAIVWLRMMWPRSIRGKVFTNQRVIIDNVSWDRCTFRGCQLVYSGGSISFHRNFVEESRFVFIGPAARAVKALHAFDRDMAESGEQPLIEATFASLDQREVSLPIH